MQRLLPGRRAEWGRWQVLQRAAIANSRNPAAPIRHTTDRLVSPASPVNPVVPAARADARERSATVTCPPRRAPRPHRHSAPPTAKMQLPMRHLEHRAGEHCPLALDLEAVVHREQEGSPHATPPQLLRNHVNQRCPQLLRAAAQGSGHPGAVLHRHAPCPGGTLCGACRAQGTRAACSAAKWGCGWGARMRASPSSQAGGAQAAVWERQWRGGLCSSRGPPPPPPRP